MRGSFSDIPIQCRRRTKSASSRFPSRSLRPAAASCGIGGMPKCTSYWSISIACAQQRPSRRRSRRCAPSCCSATSCGHMLTCACCTTRAWNCTTQRSSLSQPCSSPSYTRQQSARLARNLAFCLSSHAGATCQSRTAGACARCSRSTPRRSSRSAPTASPCATASSFPTAGASSGWATWERGVWASQ